MDSSRFFQAHHRPVIRGTRNPDTGRPRSSKSQLVPKRELAPKPVRHTTEPKPIRSGSRSSLPVVHDKPKPRARPHPIKSLRPPKPRPERKRIRPSLSDQLASFCGQQDALISDIGKLRGGVGKSRRPRSSGLAKPLLTVSTKCLTVGKIDSKFPSLVKFYHTMCRYEFHHPYSNKVITMEMFYADMTEKQVNLRSQSFQFRIIKPLEHYGLDYDCYDPRQRLIIFFSSETDTKRFIDNVYRTYIKNS